MCYTCDMRVCKTCKKELPLSEFHSGTRKDGRITRGTRCKSCLKAAYRARPDVPPAMEGTKTCNDCDTLKHVTEFPRHKKERDGRHGVCKACHRRRESEWRAKDPDRARAIRANNSQRRDLKVRYGLTLEEFDRMLAKQGGGCAICGRVATTTRLCVDHDHRCCPGRKVSCGKCIRGLLCHNCNRAIGWLGDDPGLAKKAARYLSKRRNSSAA